ncbi:sodium channel and clathrin linker 1 isoform X2 [Ictidomys tridecemlineatus]|uniref:Sodium channel and clathrin linker 1 n=1 Tax=Ictidomys tridecemlineatus TaxID=43179 RepID=A0A287D746_ICTTR|nr:sodium channel and clathrin linker 1 isoform X5 [Ictidomys tridecemlineatus]
MATEVDPPGDQNQRLNEDFGTHQMEKFSKHSSIQKTFVKGDGDDIAVNSVVDQSFLAPLITEYDKQLEELNGQLKYYQQQMGEMKLQLENVIKENERLHSELKEAVEKQLEALPFGSEIGSDIYTDEETVKNLQEQLQLANQEKIQAIELWQTVAQELDRLQKIYQEHMTKAQIQVFESQKQKDQLTRFQQLTTQLNVGKESAEMSNQHYLKALSEQSVETEQLRAQLRQTKLDLRVAVAKVEELTKVTEDLQEQMQKKEEDMLSAQGREDASDKRLHQLQTSIKQLEVRLCVAIQEANQLRTEKTHQEKQTRDLQAMCNKLENEKYEAILRARDSMQLLEEANLQKSQALLEKKQNEEDKKKMSEAVSQLIQNTSIRTKKEVENTKKQYHVQISRLTEELSALQMIYREGRGNESDYRKLEEMHQRYLIAESSKDDLQLRLKRAESRIKQLEINSSEEISRSHEMIQKLQNILEAERENCGFVSEQRLKLQQENEELLKETENLRKIALEAEKKAKLKISTMEHELLIKEHGFEVQLREMEDSNRNSTIELRHLLATQQKAADRWKEETKKLTESAEIRISNLKSELSRQKLHTQELLSQLEMANEKVAENEKLILEHQEKANRLQRRLTQAEERAASASQQLSVITVQRRKAASMMNLENI